MYVGIICQYLYELIFTVYKGKFHLSKVTENVIKVDDVATTLTTSDSCFYTYREYSDDVKGDVQKFSFMLLHGKNFKIISVT